MDFKPLKHFIRLIDERNTELDTTSVLGINIDKYFMPSVANVVGTDLSRYKLLRKGRFACNPMHVGRDGRLPVARYTEDSPAIVSPAYFMFEIIDENEIEPEYLMFCFRRPEFDRMCWFRTDASVRGGITWEDVGALEIPVPSISEQRRIVHSYQIIVDRMELLKKINQNLESQSMMIFSEMCLREEASKEWSEGTFSNFIISSISGDWGKEKPEKNNKERVKCIRGADIPAMSIGMSEQAPTRYILEKNITTKALVDNSLVIEMSGGSPTQSTGRIMLVSSELLKHVQDKVICSNFCRGIIVEDDYLYFFLMYWKYLYSIDRLFDYENSTIGLKNFDFSTFVTQEQIKIPPVELARKLNALLSPINKAITYNGFELELLTKLKSVVLSSIIK